MPHRRLPEAFVERLFLESKSNEDSVYSRGYYVAKDSERKKHFESKLRWHIAHSLSKRQKEVLNLYLIGYTEREIGLALGVTQQVVNIYKRRALNKLRSTLQ